MGISEEIASRYVRSLALGAVTLGLAATSASALTINDTFESSITSSANAAGYEAAIQQASNTIDALFGNPVTVNILFGTSSGVLGASQVGSYTSSYSNYTGLLQANATANPANTILSTAVANLHGNVGPVVATSANLRALGVTTATGFYNSSGTFVSGGGQTYDGVITLGNNLNLAHAPGLNSQAVTVIENEIDNILGGGASGSTLGTGNAGTGFGPLDLYRYQSTGPTIADADSTPSYTTNPNAVAVFSVDGGNTGIAGFNQAGAGSAYGDFIRTPCLIQSAFNCGTTETFTTASPEFQMLESIGYDPITTTPLPSTWPMLLSGLVGLGFFGCRGKKKRSVTLASA